VYYSPGLQEELQLPPILATWYSLQGIVQQNGAVKQQTNMVLYQV